MKAKQLSIAVLVFFSLHSLVVSGQGESLRFERLSTEEGLSHPNVNVFLEDTRGYMWIGTDDGLNRYNGSEFVVFKKELAHPYVKSLVEDEQGHIWIGTRRGLTLYKPELETFEHFTKVGDCQNCLAGEVISTLELDEDFLWLGTNAGLSKIDLKSHEITSWWYNENTSTVDKIFAVRDIEVVEDDLLMLATSKGLVYLNESKNEWRFFDSSNSLLTDGIETIYKDKQNTFWLASDRDGVYQVEGDIDQPTFVLRPNLIERTGNNYTVYDFEEDGKDNLWIGSYFGLTRVKGDSILFNYNDVNDPYSLSQSLVRQIYRDRNDRMWLGTPSGINIFDPYYNQFSLVSTLNDKKIEHVFCFLEDESHKLWIGTQNDGIFVIDQNDNIEHYYEGQQIYAIEQDKEGRIWAASPQKLHIIEGEKLRVVDRNLIPTNSIYQLKSDDDNTMWMATHGEGVVALDVNMNARQYLYEIQDTLYASPDYVPNIDFDQKGRIWTGNFNLGGAIIKSPKKEFFYERMLGDKSFFQKIVNDYHFQDEGVYVSTNEGLYHFPSTENLINDSLAASTKVLDAFCYELLPESEKRVWLSTTTGLFAIDTDSQTAKSYTDQIPKAFTSFNHSAAIKRFDGKIYFGGAGGIVYFDPADIATNLIAPKVRFKNLRILNNSVRVGDDSSASRSLPLEISYLDQITLDPSDKIFSIETETIELTRNKNTETWIFLDGFDEDWHLAENSAITRSNLKPGKYFLRAKAINNDGLVGQEINLKINVLAPWWAKWWAYLLYFTLALLTFLVVLSLKVKQTKRIEQVKATERESFRKRSAQDFHDEAGTKITRISMLTEMAKRAAASRDDVIQHLERIEQNVQGLNTGMRDFIWALDVDKDNLLETLTRFTDFAGSFCDDAKIDFHSSALDPELASFKTEMDDRRNILLLLKEALNNSVKHGKVRQITFNVLRKADHIEIRIEDDGMGFNSDNILEGNGLKNMRRRAEKLRADLKINSKEGKGTTVQLTLLSY